MLKSIRWLLVLLAMLAGGARDLAAAPDEAKAFEEAAKAMDSRVWERADALFGKFAQDFPQSTRLPEAVLFQAQARLSLTNYAGAGELLAARMAIAGTNADQFLFWQGEASFQQEKYQVASDSFGKLIKDHPASKRLLEAAVKQATAQAKLGHWPQVIELLRTNSVFESAARTNSSVDWLPRGYLLLSEAQLEQKDYAGAEQTLQPLAKLLLKPEIAWQRQYLLSRILAGGGRLDEALRSATNLVALATNAARIDLQAESAAFRAAILEQLGRPEEAAAAYKENLAAGMPADRQRQALLKITQLSLAQNKITEAGQILESFLGRYPDAAAADVAWLTLGELALRDYVSRGETLAKKAAPGTNAPGTTNDLQRAHLAFETLAKKFPQSQLYGKAQLDLGWCFWLEEKMPESEKAFQAAVERLPASPDQARAYFKLADAQFRQKNFTNAITNYGAVIDKFAALPEVETNLFEPGLYHIVRAGLEAGDLPATTNALRKILEWYPSTFHAERSVLLTGQAYSRQGNPAAAREIFLDYTKKVPNAPDLLALVNLAIARTYEQEGKWKEALGQYNDWLTVFTNHAARPRAEYSRALATFNAGDPTNALSYFTNFVAQFPTNDYAPLAQLWVADFYYRSGNFQRAENDYQLLAGSQRGSDLPYQALMMAGRTAVRRQSWENAKDYFLKLYNDTNCPLDLRLQALFAYGDYWMSRDSTNKLADYVEASRVFGTICEQYTNHPMAALAWGERANCRLQWAQSAPEYAQAKDDFQKVVDSPLADARARSIAKVGLAVVSEKEGQLKPALNQCLDVFHEGAFLRAGEKSDAYWLKEAGLRAGRLAEALQDWPAALRIYEQVVEKFPPLRAAMEARMKRIPRAQASLTPAAP